MRFSKKTGCFYPDEINYEKLPDDLIEVAQDEFTNAMNRAPGETLDVVKGKMVVVPAPASDPVAVLAAAKTDAVDRINAFAKSKRALIAGTPDDAEIAGWSNKLRIAQSIVAGTASDAEKAAFQAEIAVRGIQGETLDTFVQKVLKNAGFFAHAAGLVDGLKRKALDSVTAAETPDEVAAVLDSMKAQAEAAFSELMQPAQ
ncbi:hypothetical protein [Xanthomonas sp. MUS 060]|uniref:hypothetical protein n=1 Tax=Xanthomonas sp. MUS 060 TaxID=1588031 RepID=UPI0005F2D2D3|nr:hypothetical protein [Xanthomonas sp. MUS 060]